jgi:hypothetical protein
LIAAFTHRRLDFSSISGYSCKNRVPMMIRQCLPRPISYKMKYRTGHRCISDTALNAGFVAPHYPGIT